MNIRFATLEDAAAIAALHASSWSVTYNNVLSPDYLQHTVPSERQAVWHERFTNPKANQNVLVAEDAREVIGFACVFVGENVEWGSYLDNLHVSQFHQGKGIGTELLIQIASICEQTCPDQGLYLSVNQANHRAQRFYLSLGAYNAQASVWNAPDGSQVPTFRFSWQSVVPLAEKRLTSHSTQTLRAGQLKR
jgi:ribosomal protein S18 acetylase RimI-like enzyme